VIPPALVHSSQTSDVGSIPIARSINPDDSVDLARLSSLNWTRTWPVLDGVWTVPYAIGRSVFTEVFAVSTKRSMSVRLVEWRKRWIGRPKVVGSPTAPTRLTLHKDFFHQTSFGVEWEPFWNCIWEQAKQSLRSAGEIVVIGHSLPNADERARELLPKHSNPYAEILVFSGSRTAAICADFRNSGFRTVNSLGDGYFEDYLNG
jgi:hypothetical protein